MNNTDFSETIFEDYFGPENKLVVITLYNDTELTGKLTGFFKGELPWGEPKYIRWRFIPVEELNEFEFLPYPRHEIGFIILQKDIKSIRFL